MKQHNIFQSFASRFEMDEAQMIRTLKATVFKLPSNTSNVSNEITNEQLAMLLIVANNYQLNPFTREIFAYADKKSGGVIPIVSVDGWSKMINSQEDFDGIEFIYSDTIVELDHAKPCPEWIETVIYRKTRSKPVKIREYLDECYRPPFAKFDSRGSEREFILGPWQTHTKRLLRHKSLIQDARIAFGFVGIYDQDEADRIIEGQSQVVSTDPPEPPEPSKKAIGTAVKLIERVNSDSSQLQAAKDWAQEQFSSTDSKYILEELDRAIELNQMRETHLVSEAPAAAEANGKARKSPLADAKAALA